MMGKAKRARAEAPESPAEAFDYFVDGYGRPVRYSRVVGSMPNRAARRRAGIRNNLATLIRYQELMQQAQALEVERMRQEAELAEEIKEGPISQEHAAEIFEAHMKAQEMDFLYGAE